MIELKINKLSLQHKKSLIQISKLRPLIFVDKTIAQERVLEIEPKMIIVFVEPRQRNVVAVSQITLKSNHNLIILFFIQIV